jgi:hypothetical protein
MKSGISLYDIMQSAMAPSGFSRRLSVRQFLKRSGIPILGERYEKNNHQGYCPAGRRFHCDRITRYKFDLLCKS